MSIPIEIYTFDSNHLQDTQREGWVLNRHPFCYFSNYKQTGLEPCGYLDSIVPDNIWCSPGPTDRYFLGVVSFVFQHTKLRVNKPLLSRTGNDVWCTFQNKPEE